MEPGYFAVTATFTADLLEEPLSFWMNELGLDLRPTFAPYAQVLQQLLDPESLISRNRNGINVVLVRPEDAARFETSRAAGEDEARIERALDELVAALESASARATVPLLVALCPPSDAALAEPGRAAYFERVERRFEERIAPLSTIHPLRKAELAALYPVPVVNDPHGDELGHIPYTAAFFAALGTLLARKAYALLRPPRKVIAVDCDDTLWKGVVGEVGPMGVEIDAPRRALQELLVAQIEQGMLVCVVSKNDESDALDVWKHRPDMPLRRDSIAGFRINWQAKSDNVRALAEELGLGLDSFVFIDDSPIERAEMAARCPDVLTLDLPEDPAAMGLFLRHVWAFDHLRVTSEDRRRTELYKQNAERDRVRREAPTFADFLAGLDLEVEIGSPGPDRIARAAQLTQRTNQFNTTTVRRTAADIESLVRADADSVQIVDVRDRFGEYGTVGVMITRREGEALEVEALLLSCRVLGRGVENRMLRRLGEIACERGLARVDVRFTPSPKNLPARDFFDAAGGGFRDDGHHDEEGGFVYRFPVDVAATLRALPFSVAKVDGGESSREAPRHAGGDREPGAAAPTALLNHIANDLHDMNAIVAAVAAARKRVATGRGAAVPSAEFAHVPAERTPIEDTIALIWTDVLGVDPIGLDQDFFDLGGDSLTAAQVVSRLRKEFRLDLPIDVLFEARSVSALAVSLLESLALEGTTAGEDGHGDVSGLLDEIERA